MQKQYLKIGLVALLVITLCWGCRALLNLLNPLGFEGRPEKVLKREEYYVMDSRTILQDVAHGLPIHLTLLPKERESPMSAPPVQWSQADYLRIANSVFFTLWEEPVEGWKLAEIGSRVECEDIGFGMQWMRFKFFRLTKSRDVNVLTERSVYISPKENLISVFEYETFPVPVWGWPYINVGEIVPVEEVLRIAEEHGGRQVRLGLNRCAISATIIAGSNHDNWQVWYTTRDRNLFVLEVDEKNGQIVK